MGKPTFLYTVYLVYFFCGMAQCFEGIFLPEFKEHFSLTYTEQMYTMFAKNLPFACFAFFIGSVLIKKIGYKKCISLALFLFAIGTLLMIPGLTLPNYNLLLLGFFIIGTGFTAEIVAGNPLLAMLGDDKRSSSRLNTGNALGAVAQIIAPLLVTVIIPVHASTVEAKLPYIQGIFTAIAVLLLAFALSTFLVKANVDSQSTSNDSHNTHITERSIWQNQKVLLGFIAIFFVLGIEAGIFGFYRNFLEDKSILGLDSTTSQRMFTIYFAVFALGRLSGSYVQRRITPAKTVAFSLVISVVLILVISLKSGWTSVAALTTLGFFISILFPSLYAISIEGLGRRTGEASGVLTMGFLGAALIPLLQGKAADQFGLQLSFLIAIVPYLFVLFFVLRGQHLGTSRSSNSIKSSS